MKNLLIDATLLRDRLTGIERYTLEITKALVRQAVDVDCSVLLLLAHESGNPEFASLNDLPCTIIRSPFRSKLLTDQIWIPAVIARSRAHTCFFPGFPPGLAVRFVIGKRRIARTVYDAVMWRHPETLSWKNKLYMRPLEAFGIGYYDVIFTISDYSKMEISSFFPQIEQCIFNTSIGIEHQKYAVSSKQSMRPICSKYQLPDRYLLFIGTLEPRKNLPFLLDVIHSLKYRYPNMLLILVGRLGWGKQIVEETIKRLNVSEQVRILGPVEDADLTVILRSATALLFPSLYEGFGLPVIEAMASGTPVIASNSSSIPEAAGEAAILLPPDDVDAWVNAIFNVVHDEELTTTMVNKGYVQAQKFNWKDVAKKILDKL